MSNPLIKERIRKALNEGPVTADCDGDFRRVAGQRVAELMEFSNNQVLSALGSMIAEGEVSRRRPTLADRETGHRPVTWR